MSINSPVKASNSQSGHISAMLLFIGIKLGTLPWRPGCHTPTEMEFQWVVTPSVMKFGHF